MRIPSGKTDQYVYFVAVDATDLVTRETGLATWTVYRSRKGAAEVAYTTPTITEIDATNMPGVYALLVDEDTTVDSGSDSEEYCVHITHSGMAPVTRTIELYRRTATSGRAVAVDANSRVDVGAVSGTTQTAGDLAAMITTVDDFLDTEIAAILADTNELQTDWVNGGRLDLLIDSIITKIDTVDDFLDTEIAAIKARTDNLPANTSTTLTTLQNSVNTIDDFLDTEIAAIKNITDALPDSIWNVNAVGVNTAGSMGELVNDIADIPTVAEIADAVWDALIADHNDADTFGEFVQALTGGGGGGPTASQIADAVWDEALAGHVGAGSAGEALGLADDIKAKTDNLPSDPADASVVAGLISTLEGKVDVIDDFLDTEIAAIKAKTDNLPTDPADASDIAARFTTIDTNLSTVAGYLDTEIAAIKAKTDNLPASPAATGDIPTANQNADALLDRANGVETGYTPRQALRIMSAVLGGKSSGHPGSPVYRNLSDTADRVTATVSSGNRSAVTLTP